MAIEWSPEEWEEMAAKGDDSGGGGSGVDARERHKLAERERRKSMRELFLSLHALLPNAVTVRKEQSAILDEIINYIPLATARLRSLHARRHSYAARSAAAPTVHSYAARSAAAPTAPTVHVSDRSSSSASSSSGGAARRSGDCDIRMAPEPASSVAIRVRGDRVNVSLTDGKGTSQAVLLSAVVDELEAHSLTLVRSTHCRDGSKLLHHSESKISDGMERSPELLKARLQDLACKLHKLRKPSSSSSTSSSLKRSFDQIEGC